MKKIIIYFKECINGGKTALSVLLTFPGAFIIVLACFLFGLYADSQGSNSSLELMGLAIIAAIIVVIMMCLENPKVYILKHLFFSLMWLISCMVFVDLTTISFELILKTITAFEYIFLGCLLPDLATQIEIIRERNIQQNKTERKS